MCYPADVRCGGACDGDGGVRLAEEVMITVISHPAMGASEVFSLNCRPLAPYSPHAYTQRNKLVIIPYHR